MDVILIPYSDIIVDYFYYPMHGKHSYTRLIHNTLWQSQIIPHCHASIAGIPATKTHARNAADTSGEIQMTKFHMTYSRTSPRITIPYIERNNIPIMINALGRYSDNTGQIKPLNHYKTDVIVDSGGYSAMNRFGGYPFTVDEYHEWLQQHSQTFDWAAVMDFACEEKFDDIYTVKERMELTLENTIEHFEKDPDYELLPVLQGRTISDYLESYEMLRSHGIPTKKVGLGTVCRISSSNRLLQVEEELRHRTNIEWIHGFGVKIEAFKLGATFDSADSQAWVRPANYGQAYLESENKLETIDVDSANLAFHTSFKSYYDYVQQILETRDTSVYESPEKVIPSLPRHKVNELIREVGEIPDQIEGDGELLKKELQHIAKRLIA